MNEHKKRGTSLEQVFNEIVHIMRNDYAGCYDKIGCDRPDEYIHEIRRLQAEQLLTDEAVVDLVQDYLMDWNDPHLFFNAIQNKSVKKRHRGFDVRRFEDKLYVTSAQQESQLQKGMYFTSLGGIPVLELKEIHHRYVNERTAEREKWTKILALYDKGEVVTEAGSRQTINLRWFDYPKWIPTYSVQEQTPDTVMFKITDFANPDAIVNLIRNNEQLLSKAKHWIVDVRVNKGGSDSSFFPLLPYLLPPEGTELYDPTEKMLFHNTTSNAERAVYEIERQLTFIDDKQSRFSVELFLREWKKHKGKGFVEFDFRELLPENTFVKGFPQPQKVVVLTDYTCASSGDSFIEMCKKSSKVTVIGRPTAGVNDYANLLSQTWNDTFELSYPTSRLSRIDEGRGMTRKGIEPHVYIPWTPEHLKRDVDMEKAFELLRTTTTAI